MSAALGVEELALGVHDLGGPIGLDWARRNGDRVTALALLNTLVYPEFSPAVLEACTKLVYGERDRILPDIAATVERLVADIPQAEVTALPDCGHFLQEEAGAEIGELLAGFFTR